MHSAGSDHQLIDLRAVFFIQRDKAGNGAVSSVASAEDFDQGGDVFFFCAQSGEVVRHSDGDEELAQLFDAFAAGIVTARPAPCAQS